VNKQSEYFKKSFMMCHKICSEGANPPSQLDISTSRLCYEIREVEIHGTNKLKVPIHASSMCSNAPMQLPCSDTIIRPPYNQYH